eukprot:g11159.t1
MAHLSSFISRDEVLRRTAAFMETELQSVRAGTADHNSGTTAAAKSSSSNVGDKRSNAGSRTGGGTTTSQVGTATSDAAAGPKNAKYRALDRLKSFRKLRELSIQMAHLCDPVVDWKKLNKDLKTYNHQQTNLRMLTASAKAAEQTRKLEKASEKLVGSASMVGAGAMKKIPHLPQNAFYSTATQTCRKLHQFATSKASVSAQAGSVLDPGSSAVPPVIGGNELLQPMEQLFGNVPMRFGDHRTSLEVLNAALDDEQDHEHEQGHEHQQAASFDRHFAYESAVRQRRVADAHMRISTQLLEVVGLLRGGGGPVPEIAILPLYDGQHELEAAFYDVGPLVLQNVFRVDFNVELGTSAANPSRWRVVDFEYLLQDSAKVKEMSEKAEEKMGDQGSASLWESLWTAEVSPRSSPDGAGDELGGCASTLLALKDVLTTEVLTEELRKDLQSAMGETGWRSLQTAIRQIRLAVAHARLRHWMDAFYVDVQLRATNEKKSSFTSTLTEEEDDLSLIFDHTELKVSRAAGAKRIEQDHVVAAFESDFAELLAADEQPGAAAVLHPVSELKKTFVVPERREPVVFGAPLTASTSSSSSRPLIQMDFFDVVCALRRQVFDRALAESGALAEVRKYFVEKSCDSNSNSSPASSDGGSRSFSTYTRFPARIELENASIGMRVQIRLRKDWVLFGTRGSGKELTRAGEGLHGGAAGAGLTASTTGGAMSSNRTQLNETTSSSGMISSTSESANAKSTSATPAAKPWAGLLQLCTEGNWGEQDVRFDDLRQLSVVLQNLEFLAKLQFFLARVVAVRDVAVAPSDVGAGGKKVEAGGSNWFLQGRIRVVKQEGSCASSNQGRVSEIHLGSQSEEDAGGAQSASQKSASEGDVETEAVALRHLAANFGKRKPIRHETMRIVFAHRRLKAVRLSMDITLIEIRNLCLMWPAGLHAADLLHGGSLHFVSESTAAEVLQRVENHFEKAMSAFAGGGAGAVGADAGAGNGEKLAELQSFTGNLQMLFNRAEQRCERTAGRGGAVLQWRLRRRDCSSEAFASMFFPPQPSRGVEKKGSSPPKSAETLLPVDEDESHVEEDNETDVVLLTLSRERGNAQGGKNLQVSGNFRLGHMEKALDDTASKKSDRNAAFLSSSCAHLSRSKAEPGVLVYSGTLSEFWPYLCGIGRLHLLAGELESFCFTATTSTDVDRDPALLGLLRNLPLPAVDRIDIPLLVNSAVAPPTLSIRLSRSSGETGRASGKLHAEVVLAKEVGESSSYDCLRPALTHLLTHFGIVECARQASALMPLFTALVNWKQHMLARYRAEWRLDSLLQTSGSHAHPIYLVCATSVDGPPVELKFGFAVTSAASSGPNVASNKNSTSNPVKVRDLASLVSEITDSQGRGGGARSGQQKKLGLTGGLTKFEEMRGNKTDGSTDLNYVSKSVFDDKLNRLRDATAQFVGSLVLPTTTAPAAAAAPATTTSTSATAPAADETGGGEKKAFNSQVAVLSLAGSDERLAPVAGAAVADPSSSSAIASRLAGGGQQNPISHKSRDLERLRFFGAARSLHIDLSGDGKTYLFNRRWVDTAVAGASSTTTSKPKRDHTDVVEVERQRPLHPHTPTDSCLLSIPDVEHLFRSPGVDFESLSEYLCGVHCLFRIASSCVVRHRHCRLAVVDRDATEQTRVMCHREDRDIVVGDDSENLTDDWPRRQKLEKDTEREFELYFADRVVATVRAHGGPRLVTFFLHESGWLSVRIGGENSALGLASTFGRNRMYKLPRRFVEAAAAPHFAPGMLAAERAGAGGGERLPLQKRTKNVGAARPAAPQPAKTNYVNVFPDTATFSASDILTRYGGDAAFTWCDKKRLGECLAQPAVADEDIEVLPEDGEEEDAGGNPKAKTHDATRPVPASREKEAKFRYRFEKQRREQEIYSLTRQNPALLTSPLLFRNPYLEVLQKATAVDEKRMIAGNDSVNLNDGGVGRGGDGNFSEQDQDEGAHVEDEIVALNRLETAVHFLLDLGFQGCGAAAQFFLRRALRPGFEFGFVRTEWTERELEHPRGVEEGDDGKRKQTFHLAGRVLSPEVEVVTCERGEYDEADGTLLGFVAVRRKFWK